MLKRLALLLALLPLAAEAKAPPRAVKAEPGMVSAADPRATAAGVEILRAGGTAADAAVAMMAALNVVEPLHSGLGGGGFLVYSDAQHRTTSYDGRETAPAAADPYWFYVDGKPLKHNDAVPGGRSVGVPGNLKLMWEAHKAHGKLPWARLFQPAIRLARDGWQISPRLYNFIAHFPLPMDAWGKSYLYDANGQALPVGATVKNPKLAAQFEAIAAKGPDYFYKGAQAEKLVATVNGAAKNPSKMTVADLAAYQAKPRAPICGTYRIYKICGEGSAGSGSIVVLQILKQLERFDMAKLGKDSPVAWHLFAESSRLAYADRDTYLGDPDKVSVPTAGLLSANYIAERSALISPDRSIDKAEPGTPPGAPARVRAEPGPEHGTTDLVAVDRAGNVAEITTTIESVAGSGLSQDGTFLNNELTDFDIVPVKDGMWVANRVEGGKRPRSSMSPTIVYGPDGKVRIAVGAAGGSTIIAQVAKALVAVLDWKLSAQDAIALGLVYAPGDTVVLEKGTQAEAMKAALDAMGQKTVVMPLGLKANAIEWVGGHWVGAADPRSEGVAMGENMNVSAIRRAIVSKGTPSE